MSLALRWLLAAGCILMLAAVAPRLGPGPRTTIPPRRIMPASASAPSTSATQSVSTQPAQQAYSLPPDKLAKAIILSRIDTALDIAGSLWGLLVLTLLLASRRAARLAAWTERLLRRRWMQGLLFFAVYIAAITLAGLPLDLMGHLASRHYGISVQGWGSWFGDLAKALGLSLVIGTPILLLLN